jgi:predicted metalloprotease with PDZ domain
VPALVLPDPEFFTALEDEVGERVDGIVGQGLLRNFVYTVDYPGRELVLAAYPDDSHLPPGEYASLGFTLSHDGSAWRIATIEDGSDAAAQGVVPGEIVAAIAGVDIAGLAAAEIDDMIEAMAPGELVSVTLDRQGVLAELTLEVHDLLPPFTAPGGN